MKTKIIFLLLAFALILSVNAQETVGPDDYGMLEGPVYVPSLADQIESGEFKPAEDDSKKLGHPKRRQGGNVVPGKGLPKEGYINPVSELQKNTELRRNSPPIQTFITSTSVGTPSDPTGAVGPNHYVAAWNTSFRIFDKSGNPLTPAASLATLFPGNAIGDPIVFYDAAADRFVVTEFDGSPNGFNVAVCQGSNPVTDGWHVYTAGFGTGNFPDYTKFSVWGDMYMVTANIQQTNRIFAIERNEMLNGDPAQFIALPLTGILGINPFFSPQAFHTTDGNLAPAGTPCPIVFLQDDAFGGIAVDHLKIWSATIDWVTPGNSSTSAAQQLNTNTPFISIFDGGSFSNLQQPAGPNIDALQNIIMMQAQYRRFGGHNSVVFNFVEDDDPGGGKLAAVRWFELRQTSDGQPWTIFQEGTYTAPAGKHAWNASMVMNSSGDIAMGYTSMSTSQSVAINYTGRLSTDPPNIMTVAEDLIGQGSGNSNSIRYADYSQLTLDPVDESFWFVSEYFNPGRRDIVGQFVLAPPMANDIGALSIDAPNTGVLTATEDIIITIRNFGSNDITNPEVQYTIDGGAAVVENYSGTITAGTNEQFTFAQTADLSAPGIYVIEAKTNLAGDTNTGNDTATKTVENIILGVDDVELSDSELIVVSKPNNQFEFSLVTSFDGVASIAVYNVLGQTVAFNNLAKQGDRYEYSLDMSYASAGVYIIKMGDQRSNAYKTARIIVK